MSYYVQVATNVASDPKLLRLAEACRIPLPQAIGHVVLTLAHSASFSDPKAFDVSPDVVEHWAQWDGERGLFDFQLRKALGLPLSREASA